MLIVKCIKVLTRTYINWCVICVTIFSVYAIENYNLGMGGNSNFACPILPTYRGCTVYI